MPTLPTVIPTGYTCDFDSGPLTLVAATPLSVRIPVNGGGSWKAVVANTGGVNAITAGTLALSPTGGLDGPAVAFPAGLPLASLASLIVSADGEPCTSVVITLTSGAGTTARIQAGGWP